MRKSIFFLIFFFILFSVSFGFANQKQEKNGLKVQNISFEVDGDPVPTAKVPLNKTLKIHFQGVQGFHEVIDNQKKLIFPKMRIRVLSRHNEPILYEENAMETFSKQGLLAIFASNLTATIATGEPFQEGEVYQVLIEIGDMKGAGSIEYRTSLSIDKTSLRLPVDGVVESHGLNIEKTAMLKGEKLVSFNTFNTGDDFKLVLLNVSGFSQNDQGQSLFQMSLRIMNMQKEVLFFQDKLFKNPQLMKLTDGTLKTPYVTIKTQTLPAGSYIAEVIVTDLLNQNTAIATRPFMLMDLKK